MSAQHNSFRLDRHYFRMYKAEDAPNTERDYSKLTWQERLAIAHYLISAAYNLPEDNWPKMDKTYFRIRKR